MPSTVEIYRPQPVGLLGDRLDNDLLVAYHLIAWLGADTRPALAKRSYGDRRRKAQQRAAATVHPYPVSRPPGSARLFHTICPPGSSSADTRHTWAHGDAIGYGGDDPAHGGTVIC